MVRKIDTVTRFILVLSLVCCGIVLVQEYAFADEVVPVEDSTQPSLSVEEPSEPVVVPAPPVVPEVVEEEPTMLYDSDGVVVMSSEEPTVTLNAVNSSSPYGSVTTGTYVDVAAGIVPKVLWGESYVFYRSGQYSYRLVYGTLSLSDGVFSGDDCTIVDFTYADYNSGYLMSVSSGGVNLSVGQSIVYSNLGSYPVLNSDAVLIQFVCYFAVLACAVFIIHCLYSFLVRLGVRNVSE